MIRFLSLSIRNFMSYGNNKTIIHFDKSGTVLIQGINHDSNVEGIGSNGTGKTSIINALVYGLFDKPLSNISKDNLVNNRNKKNMEVIIDFEVGENHYRVKRERKTKAGAAGNNVYLWVNGVDKTVSSAETNKKIEQILGISYELFVRIVVFSASYTPFLDLPVRHPQQANQSEFIEELFSITEISAKAEILKSQIKDNESKLQILKVKIQEHEKQQKRLETLITSAKQRKDIWIEQHKKQIKELEDKLETVRNIDIDYQHSLLTQSLEFANNISHKNSEYTNTKNTIRKLIDSLNIKKSQLASLIDNKCPHCQQHYEKAILEIGQKQTDISDTNNQLAEKEAYLTQLEQELHELVEQHDNIKSQITIPNLDELIELKTKGTSLEDKLTDLKKQKNPHTEAYNEAKKAKLEPIDYDEINKLDEEIEHQKFLQKLLTKKDSFVRKALLNKNIPYLNSRLQYYLLMMGLNHKVEFTHEMTANISQFGQELDFGNLSTGQKARVNFALSLAFNDVLQKMHSHINISLLDEVLDVGLDASGIQAAASLLKLKAKESNNCMFVITHRDEISANTFDSTLTVEMIKGFSYITQN